MNSIVLVGVFCFFVNFVGACDPTITTASGTRAPSSFCSGELIFEDNFDTLDESKWKHEITLGGGGSRDVDDFVGEPGMKRAAIRFRAQHDGRDAQFTTRPDDAHSNFTAVGDQHFGEQGHKPKLTYVCVRCPSGVRWLAIPRQPRACGRGCSRHRQMPGRSPQQQCRLAHPADHTGCWLGPGPTFAGCPTRTE